MTDGKHCPACGWDIGIWPVFSAGLPNRIWCPHCSARLAYRGIGGVLIAVAALLVVAVAGAYAAATAFAPPHRYARLAVFVGVLLGSWAPVELAVAWFMRGHCPLIKHGEAPRDGDRDRAGSDAAAGGGGTQAS